jgi:hypothetical protein
LFERLQFPTITKAEFQAIVRQPQKVQKQKEKSLREQKESAQMG